MDCLTTRRVYTLSMKKYLNLATVYLVVFALFCLSSYAVLAHGNDYRSNVANVVSKLKDVAGKNKNIGEEVRQIDKEQEESVEEVESAKEAVEKKGDKANQLLIINLDSQPCRFQIRSLAKCGKSCGTDFMNQ